MRVDLIPIFDDNYVFVIRSGKNSAIVVDPGESSAVSAFLKRENLKLEAIFITHHHTDHMGGVAHLLNDFSGVRVIGPRQDLGRWPFTFEGVGEGDLVAVGDKTCRIFEVPGHTKDHVAYWFESHQIIFSGDVLFGLGCGRLFEGTAAEMFESLTKLKNLPPETRAYCTHEYTEQNFKFVASASPPQVLKSDLANYETRMRTLRLNQQPTVPLLLSEELKCNPLLMASSVEEFRDWRHRRDQF